MPDLSAPTAPAVTDEIHPTKEDPIQGTLYMLHCTVGGCGAYIDDVKEKPPVDFICDDCLAK